MNVIPPLRSTPFAIDAAMLTSTSAPEPGVGETAWSSGTTYAKGDREMLGAPSSAVTLSIASPGVVGWTANGLPNATPVVLTTTGALPTGLTSGRVYYVVGRQADSFRLSAEPNGVPIVTSGAQSGVHTATAQVHRVYESLVASNLNRPPAIDDGTGWIDVGPTNRWAMFDLLRNTQTVTASPLTVTLTPGERVDSIGLVGLVADTATITVTSSGVTVHSYTQDLTDRPTTTWYEYFFGPFRQIAGIARLDLPPYTNAVITVTLSRASGDVSCGGLVLGRKIYIGDVQYSAESDALNFSTIDRNTFGDAILVPRRNVPKTVQTLRCAKSLVNRVLQARDDLNAVPALWVALDDPQDGFFEALLILGIYKRWLINTDLPTHAQEQLELEEV